MNPILMEARNDLNKSFVNVIEIINIFLHIGVRRLIEYRLISKSSNNICLYLLNEHRFVSSSIEEREREILMRILILDRLTSERKDAYQERILYANHNSLSGIFNVLKQDIIDRFIAFGDYELRRISKSIEFFSRVKINEANVKQLYKADTKQKQEPQKTGYRVVSAQNNCVVSSSRRNPPRMKRIKMFQFLLALRENKATKEMLSSIMNEQKYYKKCGSFVEFIQFVDEKNIETFLDLFIDGDDNRREFLKTMSSFFSDSRYMKKVWSDSDRIERSLDSNISNFSIKIISKYVESVFVINKRLFENRSKCKFGFSMLHKNILPRLLLILIEMDISREDAIAYRIDLIDKVLSISNKNVICTCVEVVFGMTNLHFGRREEPVNPKTLKFLTKQYNIMIERNSKERLTYCDYCKNIEKAEVGNPFQVSSSYERSLVKRCCVRSLIDEDF